MEAPRLAAAPPRTAPRVVEQAPSAPAEQHAGEGAVPLMSPDHDAGTELDGSLDTANGCLLRHTVGNEQNVVGLQRHVRRLPGQDAVEVDGDLLAICAVAVAAQDARIRD